jgi:hypothetical protein
MRWDDAFKGGHECYRWYDLLEGEGTETDPLLGYVRENLVDHTFIAQINSGVYRNTSKKFDNLEDAKNFIIAHYVVEKLEGA